MNAAARAIASASRRPTPTDVLALIVVAGQWSALARAAIGVPLYAAFLDAGLVAVTAVVVLGALRSEQWRVGWRTSALVLAYMALAAVQVLNPNVPEFIVGLEGYRKTAFTMIAFFAVLLSDRGDSVRFFKIVAIGSLPTFVWALHQAIDPLPIDFAIIATSGVSDITFRSSGILRAFAPTAGPFHLGVIAASVAIISLVMWRVTRHGWLVLAVVAGTILGLTITRANMFAAALAFFVLVLATPSVRARLWISAGSAVTIVAIGLAALFTVGAIDPSAGSASPTPTPVATPSPTATPTPDPNATPTIPPPPPLGGVVSGITDPLDDRNLRLRFGYWVDFVEAIAERPLVGYGTSAAADGFQDLYAGTGSTRFSPHSMYFKAALELGLAGLALLLALLVAEVRHAMAARARAPAVAAIVLGIVAVTAVSGITGPMLDAYPFNVLYWAAFGWVVRIAAVGLPPEAGSAPHTPSEEPE